MEKEEYRKQLLLDVAGLNEKKVKILNDMADLEILGNFGKEYSDLVDSYEIIHWYLNKKLEEADLLDKNVVCASLVYNNPGVCHIDNFMDIINNVDQMLPLRKVICDLGGKTLNFYDYETETKNIEYNHRFKNMMKNIKNVSDIKLKCDVINAYMVHDFTNMMFSVIMNDIERVKSDKIKELLLALKYNLIYVSNDLENMAIKNKFKFSKEAKLLDEKTINAAGITKHDYLDSLDYVFCGLLEDSVNDAVTRVYEDNLPSLEYSDHILIKTTASLITNKRECDDLILEPNDEMEPNIRKANMMINIDLLESKKVDSYTRKKLVK